MRYGFSVLMFCFAGMILIYALMVWHGGFNMIFRHWAVKVNDKKAYARRFAKILAIVAIAPALSGLAGVIVDMEESPFLPMVVFAVGLPVAIWLGVKMTEEKNRVQLRKES